MSRAVILVEGESDKAALGALADRLDRDLDLEGIQVVAMGGAGNVRHHMASHAGTGVVLAGLYDIGEMRELKIALEGSGFGPVDAEEDTEHFGFFACHDDLEDELIRALGVPAAEEVIAAQGELNSLRRMQAQPAQRDRPRHEQLHRFIGTRSGRKATYARLMVEALPLEDVPRPLRAVFARVAP